MCVSRSLAASSWLVLGLLSACGDSMTGTSFTNPTYVAVDPQEFTLRIPCSSDSVWDADAGEQVVVDAGNDADAGSVVTAAGEGAEPALRSYAAALLRVETTKAGTSYEVIATSPIASCRTAVRFKVQTNTTELFYARYAANLMGFEAPASAVVAPKGKPTQVAKALLAKAQWVGSCGQGRIDTEAPGDAGRLQYPLENGEIDTDSGAVNSLFGPKQAVSGRTITLQGCALDTP